MKMDATKVSGRLFWYSCKADFFPLKRGMGAQFLLFWLSPSMCIPEGLKKVADFRARLKTYLVGYLAEAQHLCDFLS